MREPEHLQDKGTEFDRLKALSDGIFAIVLTLLILELRLPEMPANVSNQKLLLELTQLIPKFVSYVITYFMIGVFWVVHNRQFRHIVRYDRKLLWQNLFFLFFVSLLPFTTALSGSYWNGLAWQIYAVNVAAAVLSSAALWNRAAREGMVDPALSPVTIEYVRARSYPVPVVFLVSVFVAMFSTWGAHFCPMLLPWVYALLSKKYSAGLELADSPAPGTKEPSAR
jgi:uncharacterized membrane protein